MTSPKTEVCEPHKHPEIKTEHDMQSQELSSQINESTCTDEENQQTQSKHQPDEQPDEQQIQPPQSPQPGKLSPPEAQQQQPTKNLTMPVEDRRKRKGWLSSQYDLEPDYKKQSTASNYEPGPSAQETSWPLTPDLPLSGLPDWDLQAIWPFERRSLRLEAISDFYLNWTNTLQNFDSFMQPVRSPAQIQQNDILTFPINPPTQPGSNPNEIPPTLPMPLPVPSTSVSSQGSNPIQGKAGSRWQRLKKFFRPQPKTLNFEKVQLKCQFKKEKIRALI